MERTIAHQMVQIEKKGRWTLSPLIDLSEARLLAREKVDRLAATCAERGRRHGGVCVKSDAGFREHQPVVADIAAAVGGGIR